MSIPFVMIAAYVSVFAMSAAVVAAKIVIAGRSSRQCVEMVGDTFAGATVSGTIHAAANESHPTSLAA